MVVVLDLKECKLMILVAVNDLRDEVVELRNQVKQMTRDSNLGSKTTELPPLLPIPKHLKHKEPNDEGDNGHGSNGHCFATQN